MKPTKQDIIELLRNQVQHNRITMDELEQECKHHGIDLFDDVIHPIDYNLCNRCGEIAKDADYESDNEYTYYCPNCDEDLYTFETHGKLGY